MNRYSTKLIIIFFLCSIPSFFIIGAADNTTVNSTGLPPTNPKIAESTTEDPISVESNVRTSNYFTDHLWVIIPIILGIFSIIQTYRINSFQKIVAEKQGIFREPNVLFNTYDSKWRESAHFTPDYFILAGKLSPKRMLVFPLIITIKNTGNKSAKDISVTLHYLKNLRGGGLKVGKIEPEDDYSKNKFPRIHEFSNFQIADFEIGTLTPQQSFTMKDIITPEATSSKFDVDVVSKDGVPLIVSGEIFWQYRIDYTIYQEDFEPISGSIGISFIDTSEQTLEEYLDSYNEKMKDEYRKRVNKQKFNLFKLKSNKQTKLKKVQFVFYDESIVNRNSKVPIDEIPIEALRFDYGFTDYSGSIYKFPKKTELNYD